MQMESQQCSGQTTAIYIKLKDKRIIGRSTFMKCCNNNNGKKYEREAK